MEWLLDVLPKDGSSFVLAGHSWGGGAAARFAVAHPQLVSKLVLVGPHRHCSPRHPMHFTSSNAFCSQHHPIYFKSLFREFNSVRWCVEQYVSGPMCWCRPTSSTRWWGLAYIAHHVIRHTLIPCSLS